MCSLTRLKPDIIVFLNEPDVIYDGEFSQIGNNQVRLVFESEVPSKDTIISGFNLVNEHNSYPQRDCTDYTCIYRTYPDNSNKVELCDNNIPWSEQEFAVQFNSHYGGIVDGEINQIVKNYEELVIPTPVADENYTFTGWTPEIPTDGKIEKDMFFSAQFKYVETLEEYKEERQLENKAKLAEFLKANPILWTDGLYYGVTQEDQNEMNLDFTTYQLKQTLGDTEWKLQWHSIKSVCRDFTMEEFCGLLNTIIEFVYPYRQLEMQYKEAIYNATTKEEIDAVNIVYQLKTEESNEQIEVEKEETNEQ